MNKGSEQFDEHDAPPGWKVDLNREGDIVRYKYSEVATGECIEGSALASNFRSPGKHIRKYIHEREEKSRLETAGVTGAQIARKILMMVGRLHQVGFESLYIDPYMAPSGFYWRYSIGVCRDGLWPQEGILGLKKNERPEGSIVGGYNQRITWGYVTDSVEEFAKKFYARYLRDPASANARATASVSNTEYVEWYKEMLEQTAPNGVLVFGCDGGAWYEHAFTWGGPSDFRMAMPPGFKKR